MGAVPDASVDIPRQSGASRKIALVMFVTRNAPEFERAVNEYPGRWSRCEGAVGDEPALVLQPEHVA
jgi:hypothetical protein